MTETQEITNQDLYDIYQEHYKDDATSFHNINKQLEKNKEIAIANGEHMSSIRLELTDVNGNMAKLSVLLAGHIKDIQPILEGYNDTQATYRTFGRIIKPLVTCIVTVGSVISAWWIIKKTTID